MTENLEVLNSGNESDNDKYSHCNLFRKQDMQYFLVVENEDVIASFQEYMHMGEKSPYAQLIERAGFIKRQGLTPIFMSDAKGTKMVVTSDEHVRLKLH